MDKPTPLAMPHPVYGHYPPTHIKESSTSTFDLENASSLTKNQWSEEDARNISRTPSPTLEEDNFLHGIKKQRTTRENIIRYAVLAVILTLVILISVFTKKIVNALHPETTWMRDHPAGFLIPIALLIIVSFPPLFGAEIICMLVGITWDLWPAFAIACVGTLIGETVNFLIFKYACTARSEKIQEKNLDYGLMAHIVRRGGLLMLIMIRYSAVPTHYATAVFATVGISFLNFLISAVASLPNLFVTVYTGYAMKPSVADNKTSEVIMNIVLVIGIVITLGTYYWVQKQLKAARADFVYGRRKARQAKRDANGVNGVHEISLPPV